MSETGDLITRMYGNFRGVDFRGEEVNLSRSPDSVNMWKDYRETESIRTRPPIDNVSTYSPDITGSEPLYGVHWYDFYDDTYLFIHYGTKLLQYTRNENGTLKSPFTMDVTMNPATSVSFVCDEALYILNGDKCFYVYGSVGSVGEVEPYVPTTTIGRKPAGGGTIYEDVNLLTPRRKNTFVADGESTRFVVDGYMDGAGKVIVKVNGNVLGAEDYTTFHNNSNTEFGVEFVTPPPAPNTDGQDNVEIEYTAMGDSGRGSRNKRMITMCTKAQVFDNRVFVYGNPEYPNRMWHSALNNPTYFSDLDYYDEGQDKVAITALVPGNNALWVFREPSATNANVFYHTPTIDPEYGKIYPSTHSNATIGCIGGAINFNDTIVYFSNRGMEGINADITTEQSVVHKSSMVDSKLLSEANYKKMILAECEGYLFVIIDNKIYLADSRAVFSNMDHVEYEWFYWEAPRNIIHASTYNGQLYIIYDNGSIMTLDLSYTSYGFYPVHSHWVTPKDKFNAPNKLKTTNKRGCVVEATGDIKVSVKTEGTEFEPIGTYEKVTDYFVSRIKRKKWKDIQLRFESESRFSLETATLEAFVGGYIKR